MKKRISVLIVAFLLLTSCGRNGQPRSSEHRESELKKEIGIWLSYTEIDELLASEKGIKAAFSSVLEQCERMKISSLYLQVRPFCDALYPSAYFPEREKAKAYDFDVFRFMLEESHKVGIKVHAWINPYRVSTAVTEVDTLPKDSPVYRWYHDSDPGNDDTAFICNGIYLNPAKEEVRKLVLNGIREILQKYPVDGIHFDDYFYPGTDPEFDRKTYELYRQKAAVAKDLADWRRSHVDALIEGCHTAIGHLAPSCVFSISPAASVEKNREELYADLKKWIENGWIDRVIPQLYFGFEYPDPAFRFETLLEEWKKISAKNESVELQIGLGCYKIETDSKADLPEWSTREDIVARQTELCLQNPGISGVVFFSYRSLFSENERNTKQRENILGYLASQ